MHRLVACVAATQNGQYGDAIERLATPLRDAFEAEATSDWQWFEETMTTTTRACPKR